MAEEKKYTWSEYAFLLLVVLPTFIALRAWIFSLGWRWLIRPVFASAPVLGVREVASVIVVHALFTLKPGGKYRPIFDLVFKAIFYSAFDLLTLYVARCVLWGIP